jgi:PadR family transcriptional regulator PadR
MTMREPSFLTLIALAGGRAHGYGLLREVESVSGGRVRLQVGSLYAVLERLQREGLVAIDGEEVHGGRLRRYFVLTDEGRGALEREVDRLEANARVARQRLGLALRPASQS